MDIEADAIIRALFKRNPDTAYRVTMLAMSLAAAMAVAPPAEPPRPRHWNWLLAWLEKRGALHLRREHMVS